MALFGDLQHHGLADLAKVLHTRTGTLFFHSAYQGRTLELNLIQGHLRAMYLDGFPILELAQVREILGQLRAQAQGAFEFQPPNTLKGDTSFYNLSLAELVQDTAGTAIPADQLPHPDTRFALTPQPPQVPASLAQVWAMVQPHLAGGSSAAELTARVGLPQQEVLAALYRLRAVDLIAPQRAIPVTTVPATLLPMTSPSPPPNGTFTGDETMPVTPAPAPRPLVQRLLGALRRFTRGVGA